MNIFEKVASLNLPIGKYVVFGSGPLQARGIRESRDIDILTLPEIYDQLKNQGDWEEKIWPNGDKYLEKDSIEVGFDWVFKNGDQVYDPNIQKLIDEAEIINGIPFVRLEEVMVWKQVRGKEKDLEDIKLIRAYLSSI